MFEALDDENLVELEENVQDYDIHDFVGFRETGICYLKKYKNYKLITNYEELVSSSKKNSSLEAIIFEEDDPSKHEPPYAILPFEEGFTAIFSKHEGELYLGFILSENGNYVEDVETIRKAYYKSFTDEARKITTKLEQLHNLSRVSSSPHIYYKLIKKQKEDLLNSVKQYENCIMNREELKIIKEVRYELQRSVHNYFSLLYSYKQTYKNSKGILFLTHTVESDEIDKLINIRHVIQHDLAPEITQISTPSTVTAAIDQSAFSRDLYFHENSKNKEHFRNRSPLEIEKIVDKTWSWIEESHRKYIQELENNFQEEFI